MKFTVLWTDALIYCLMLAILIAAILLRKNRHYRSAWRQVFQNSKAMITFVILLAFIVTGLLDSIHYRPELETVKDQEGIHYAPYVRSILEDVVSPLDTQQEKTYSAPFARTLYVKEFYEGEGGEQLQKYFSLKYGGQHLTKLKITQTQDILQTLIKSFVATLVTWLFISFLLVLLYASITRIPIILSIKRIIKAETRLKWRTALMTTGVLLLVLYAMAFFMHHYHVLGTDKVGQDILFISLKSVRTGLVIGTLTTLIMFPFAAIFGIMAGFIRGWVDDIIQYIYTTLSSIPAVLLIAAVILSLQVYIARNPDWFDTAAQRADARLLMLCVILGITSWTGLCRLLRGETLKLREIEYIQSAKAFGVSRWGIMFRHILPNVMHIILISIIIDFSGLVLAEAVLSYVGVGVDPSSFSWGNMINSARLEMAREPVVWWSITSAFAFMFTLVLSANLFADVVRDAFDPRVSTQV